MTLNSSEKMFASLIDKLVIKLNLKPIFYVGIHARLFVQHKVDQCGWGKYYG